MDVTPTQIEKKKWCLVENASVNVIGKLLMCSVNAAAGDLGDL